jgi:hypothetical protein
MTEVLQVKRGGEGEVELFLTSESEAVVQLSRNVWESDFFGRRQGTVSLRIEPLRLTSSTTVASLLEALSEGADDLGYDLVELRVDASGFRFLSDLEDAGFRLVDSRVRFLTLLEKKELPTFPVQRGTIRQAHGADLSRILELTYAGFVRNPSFESRFKNPRYYGEGEAERYYAAWIENALRDDRAVFVAYEVEGKVEGYCIYRRGEERHWSEAVYKGILEAVSPEFRGEKVQLAMQSYIYALLPEERWYVDNTTQLTNYAVMKNHVRFQKSLESIELVFYRESHATPGWCTRQDR